MKKYYAIILFVLAGTAASAKADSIYKYVYSFGLPAPGTPNIKIRKSTQVFAEIRNVPKAGISFVIWLKENQGKRFYFSTGSFKIDTTLMPGNYHIAFRATGYRRFDTSLTIAGQTAFHFNVMLLSSPTPAVYEIESRKELTPQQVDEIKACVFKKSNIQKCDKKRLYYISLQL